MVRKRPHLSPLLVVLRRSVLCSPLVGVLVDAATKAQIQSRLRTFQQHLCQECESFPYAFPAARVRLQAGECVARLNSSAALVASSGADEKQDSSASGGRQEPQSAPNNYATARRHLRDLGSEPIRVLAQESRPPAFPRPAAPPSAYYGRKALDHAEDDQEPPSTSLLNRLFYEHASDRGFFWHYYGDLYDMVFTSTIKKHRCEVQLVLEVGLGSYARTWMATWMNQRPDYKIGASLKVWRDFFPNAFVVGIDILQESVDEVNDEVLVGTENERVVAFQSSSFDRRRMDAIMGRDLLENKKFRRWFAKQPQILDGSSLKFDVIIDDGWHDPPANQATLAVLWPYLSPSSGQFVIEDVPTHHVDTLQETLQNFFFRRRIQMLIAQGSVIGENFVLVLTRNSERDVPSLYPQPLLDRKMGATISKRSILAPAHWRKWWAEAVAFWEEQAVIYSY